MDRFGLTGAEFGLVMVRLVAKNCPSCGAPLPLTPNAREVPCSYCGNVIHIEWTAKAPPPTQAPYTLYVRPATSSAWIWIVVLSTALPMLIGLVIAVSSIISTTQTVNRVVSGAVPTVVEGPVTFPVSCGMNRELKIVGQKFVGSGTLITGDVNCKLTIKDSELTADVIVLAKNVVEVTVENSRLNGRETAIKSEMNTKIRVTKQSRLTGKEAGIVAGLNTELSVSDSRIEGEELGVRGESNLRIELRQATIAGKQIGLRSGSNLKLTMVGGALNGTRGGLVTDSNLTLSMRGGIIQAFETAVSVSDANAEIELEKGAKLTAREVALKVGTNLSLVAEDALIEAQEVAIETGHNPKFELRDKARITGRVYAIRAAHNLHLSARGATISSDEVAICGEYNAEISARQSRISGKKAAFRFVRRPSVLNLVATEVTGPQIFNAPNCGG